MEHLVGKDIYRDPGRKIDGLSVRTPWNETLREILRNLLSAILWRNIVFPSDKATKQKRN